MGVKTEIHTYMIKDLICGRDVQRGWKENSVEILYVRSIVTLLFEAICTEIVYWCPMCANLLLHSKQGSYTVQDLRKIKMKMGMGFFLVGPRRYRRPSWVMWCCAVPENNLWLTMKLRQRDLDIYRNRRDKKGDETRGEDGREKRMR